MSILETLQARIKGSRLYNNGKIERLYIPFIRDKRGLKSSIWFEVVNDRLNPFVRIEQMFGQSSRRDESKEQDVKQRIIQQFYEIIHNCELERKKVPLSERLADDIIPVYSNSLKHQVAALRFLCSMKVSALFADTGTGKSKISIDLCTSRVEAGQINKVLIICPVSVKRSFEAEIKKWEKGFCNYKIVGHETIGSSDNTFLELKKWIDSETQIIIDESHLIKNPLAKRSKRIKQLCEQTSFKLVMTGTPLSENVHNLYMQYSVLSDLIIGVSNWLKFEEKYCIMGGFTGAEIIGFKNLDYLMGLLEPYTWQISKEECLDLPSKIEYELFCNFTQEQDYYYYIEKEKLLEVIKSDNLTATDIFKTFSQMQKIASGMYKKQRIGCNKIELFERVDLTIKTIVFCKYIFEVNDVINHLGKDKCTVFTGENLKERYYELELFCKSDKQFFVATMQTGGTGLNGLQEVCSQIIFYSSSFSYLQKKQCIGRIDRKGQEAEMKVISFSTNSGIDQRIAQVLARKSSMTEEIKKMLSDKIKLKKEIEKL